MKTLREYIADAEAAKVAIGHFNISDLTTLKAIFEAARACSSLAGRTVPVIIGVSEGERAFVGVPQVAALVESFRKEFDYPIFLNADHTRSLPHIQEAVEAGFDAVLFDAGALPLSENIAKTKEVVEYVRTTRPTTLVEGELGYIGTSSTLLTEIPEGAAVTGDALTKPEDALRFVQETGVDLIGPAVGNIHGMLKNTPDPRLDIARIKAIRTMAGVPLVLHGGSGSVDEDFTAAIQAGISIIHINTELRVAWRKGIEGALAQHPDEIVPYKLLEDDVRAVQDVVLKRLKLFNNLL